MTKLNIQRCCRKPDNAKCLLDAVESPCHSYIHVLLQYGGLETNEDVSQYE